MNNRTKNHHKTRLEGIRGDTSVPKGVLRCFPEVSGVSGGVGDILRTSCRFYRARWS